MSVKDQNRKAVERTLLVPIVPSLAVVNSALQKGFLFLNR
jgi:hypothetical protein